MGIEDKGRRILSDEELAALTEGLTAPVQSVLVLSPFVNDQQVLAGVLREKGFRVIAAARGTWPEGTAERVAAAVIAIEVLQDDPGVVAQLRKVRKGLPLYVIGDGMTAPPVDIAPPTGIWTRDMLGDCVAMLAPGEEPEVLGVPEGTSVQEPTAVAPSAPAVPSYAEVLEALLAPGDDVPTLVRRVLRVLKSHCGAAVAAVLVHHGGFFLEVEAEAAEARGQAGRYLMEAGRQFLFQARAARARPNAFAAVDCVPLAHGGHGLGALFLFWTREAPAPNLERAATRLASRLWELLARSAPAMAFVPYEAFLQKARTHAGALLMGAPLPEERLERLLVPGEYWTREPQGAVLCCLLRPPEIVIAACGDALAGFCTSPERHEDLGAWIRSHSEVLAELRRAGRSGVVSV